MTVQSKSIVIYEISKRNKLEIPVQNESVWLSASQMSELFDKDIKTIYEHISNVYKDKELMKKSTVRKFQTVQLEGKQSKTRNL